MKLNNAASMSAVILIMVLVSATNGRILSFRMTRLSNETYDDAPPVSSALTPPDEIWREFHCLNAGSFPVQGSGRAFYRCEHLPGWGLTAQLCTCPPESYFSESQDMCTSESQEPTTPVCVSFQETESTLQNAVIYPPINGNIEGTHVDLSLRGAHTLQRPKRFIGLIFGGISVYQGYKAGKSLSRIENKLDGIDAGLKRSESAIVASRIENAVNAKITHGLIHKGIAENAINFEITQNLVSQSILETRVNAAITQGLIIKGNVANEINFVRVHTGLSEVQKLIDTRIREAKSDMEKGFQSISEAIDRSRTEPLVSKILTAIKGYHQKTSHLLVLSKQHQRDEMTKSGGYIDFVTSSLLEGTLRDIIHQRFAIPSDASDLSAMSILDLLVDGLQVHVSMLKAIASSNMFIAGEELKDKNLDMFNTFMQRSISSLKNIEINLGYEYGNGLGIEIDQVLEEVQGGPYIDDISGLAELVLEKQANITILKSEVKNFITENSYLEKPSSIEAKLDFKDSNIQLPVGPWENRARVSYAIQLASEKGISEVGDWSRPYTVVKKGNPIVTLPPAEAGETRLVYRKFNAEMPEVVAIVSDREQNSFRDIERDMINAASRPNEDLALEEIQQLLSNDAAVNTRLDNDMTPLHIAAKYGNVRVMEALLNKGADLHAKTSDDENALHIAALYNKGQVIEFLVNKGSFLNSKTKSLHWTPLHIAVANNHDLATRTLLDHNADIKVEDIDGLTPLHLSTLGNGDTMEILLRNSGVDVNAKAKGGQTPLHYAAQSSNPALVKKLMEHRETEINTYNDAFLSPLHYAAMTSSMETITTMIQQGASPYIFDKEGSSPFHYAAFFGNKNAVLGLVDQTQSFKSIKNWKNQYALDMAIASKHSEIVEIMRNSSNLAKDGFEQEFMADTGISLSDVSCAHEVSKQLAEQSEDACMNAGHISKFVDTISFKSPLPVHEAHSKFTQMINSYNIALQNSKSNIQSWDQQDGIQDGIVKAFHVAKAFEALFENRYNTKQKHLRSLSGEKTTQELEELITFLELVKEDADEVSKASESAKQQCQTLSSILDTDANEFEKSKLVHALEERSNHSTALKVFKTRQEVHKNDILTLKQSILEAYNQSHQYYKELRALKIEIIHRIGHIPTERFATTISSAALYIIAQILLPLETPLDQKKINGLLNSINQNNAKIDGLEADLKRKEKLVGHYEKLFMFKRNSGNMVRDLEKYRNVECNIQDIMEIIPYVKSSVSEVIETLVKIESTFGDVIRSVGDMIDTGRAASTGVMKERAVSSINEGLSKLRCYWKGTGINLADLRECINSFYFVYPKPEHGKSRCPTIVEG